MISLDTSKRSSNRQTVLTAVRLIHETQERAHASDGRRRRACYIHFIFPYLSPHRLEPRRLQMQQLLKVVRCSTWHEPYDQFWKCWVPNFPHRPDYTSLCFAPQRNPPTSDRKTDW